MIGGYHKALVILRNEGAADIIYLAQFPVSGRKNISGFEQANICKVLPIVLYRVLV